MPSGYQLNSNLAQESKVHRPRYGERLVIVCGLHGGSGCGKYVVGTRQGEGETDVFAFDPSCELHRDIGERFRVIVRGGGHLAWNAEKKQIELYGTSQEFGMDPDRCASRDFLAGLFPGWRIG